MISQLEFPLPLEEGEDELCPLISLDPAARLATRNYIPPARSAQRD